MALQKSQWLEVLERQKNKRPNMTSTFLLIAALIWNGLVYKKLGRSFICLAIIFMTSVHYYLFDSSVSFMYYGTAALACLITITVLEMMPKSPLVVDIQVINFAGILVNFIGYGMYEAYLSPYLYDSLMYCLFAVEVFRLFIRTKHDREYEHIARDCHLHNNGSSSSQGGL